MNNTKRFLNISIGISMIICSIALLIFSAKNTPARAQQVTENEFSGFNPVGVITLNGKAVVIGYSPSNHTSKVISTVK